MDFHSRRITAILENALREDSAARDATSYAVVEANQRGTGTIISKQDCILSGVGIVSSILDVFATLDGTVVAHGEVTSHPVGQEIRHGAVDLGHGLAALIEIGWARAGIGRHRADRHRG